MELDTNIAMKTTNQPKYKIVYNKLISDINKESFKIGSKLPSERMLAKNLNVNMSTVRRAFKELRASGIVEKKVGSGTYLKRFLDDDWENKPVNIVLPTHANPMLDQVELIVPAVAARHNRKQNIIYAHNSELPELIQSFILHKQPTILLGVNISAVIKEIMKAPELFVVLANPTEGIPSIVCDDNHGIRMLMDYLMGYGHKRIAIFHGNIDNPVIKMQQAVYKSCIMEYYTPDLDICINSNTAKNYIDLAYETMLVAAEKTDFSAILCLNDEIMLAAMAAFYMLNKKVPADISVVSIGNTYLSRYSSPPTSCYDPNLEQHFNQAFLLLEKNHQAPNSCERLRLVNPFLVKRDSVKNIKK